MEIDFGVMDSLVRAKMEEVNAIKENRENFLKMLEKDDEDYKSLKAMVDNLEGEIAAYSNLLDLLVSFIPEEYNLPEDLKKAFLVKVDIAKFRTLIDLLYDEGVNTEDKDEDLPLSEKTEKQVLKMVEGKTWEEVESMMYFRLGRSGVYEWVDVFLDNMMTSYEGRDSYLG